MPPATAPTPARRMRRRHRTGPLRRSRPKQLRALPAAYLCPGISLGTMGARRFCPIGWSCAEVSMFAVLFSSIIDLSVFGCPRALLSDAEAVMLILAMQ